MTIRQVKKLDNLSLANIIRKVFVEYNAPKKGTVYSDPTTNKLYQFFQIKKAVLWVAEENKKILGCCGVYPTIGLPEDCVELVKFYLPKESRGKGFGKILMEKSIDSAKEFGYSEIYIESLPEFSNAVRIYKKQGFLKRKKPLGESGHTSCNIWMLKKLNEI